MMMIWDLGTVTRKQVCLMCVYLCTVLLVWFPGSKLAYVGNLSGVRISFWVIRDVELLVNY